MSGIEGLQLTRAEFDEAAAPASCTTCLNPLSSEYFQLNGAIVCPPLQFSGPHAIARPEAAVVVPQ